MIASSPQGIGVIIAAAGEGRRMGGVDKVFVPLGGRSILVRVIDVFASMPQVEQIVAVVSETNLERCRGLLIAARWSTPVTCCRGGRRRQDSVAAGLKLLNGCGWVIVHDGARPLVTHDLITRGLEAATETGAAVAAVPVSDTIKQATEELLVRRTLPRRELWAAQTPQVFRYDIIMQAYQNPAVEVTDDASLVEALGCPVKLYMGSYDNIKVTGPGDLDVAEALLRKDEK